MSRTRLSPEEAELVSRACPGLPAEYLLYLVQVGWGQTESGRMIYSGPTDPAFVYGEDCSATTIVLLGDDFQGYCFGYDLAASRFGEFTPQGEWQPWREGKGFVQYVA